MMQKTHPHLITIAKTTLISPIIAYEFIDNHNFLQKKNIFI